ncbi:MAG TPA: S1/P1 nuclease [Rhizomicrobium sp.]|nr:S1/P1 nuclease [Rhizomicrobium sp.]
MMPPLHRRVACLFALIPALLIPGHALAWAPEGHQIVAAIAERELSPKARAAVSALLENPGIMVLDSSWADEIRQQRPETTPWHYVNIEIGSGAYSAARDCGDGNCVVAQIGRDEKILSDPHASKDARAEALRFLIHFVADLHQPLHAADRNDQGGNDALFRWHGKRVSLHQIWDQDVVAALGGDSMRAAAEIDRSLTPQQKSQMGAGSVEDWTNESFHLAESEIYALPPSRLPEDYATKESAIARRQLAKAGIRLATILNRVFR